jgi:hypothetical protein
MSGIGAAPKRGNALLPLLIGIAVVAVGYMLWRTCPISVR